MEFDNVVVDDFNDFLEFSKEEEITSFSDEIVETSSAEQITEAKYDNVATSVDTFSEQNVATSDDQNHHETESAATSMFDDPIKKEPSSRIRKNHPFDIIIGNPSDSMITRHRYMNLIGQVDPVKPCMVCDGHTTEY